MSKKGRASQRKEDNNIDSKLTGSRIINVRFITGIHYKRELKKCETPKQPNNLICVKQKSTKHTLTILVWHLVYKSKYPKIKVMICIPL